MSEVIFPAGAKLKLLALITYDRGCTPFDLRVAMALVDRTDRHSGQVRLTQKWIATKISRPSKKTGETTERGVRKAIGRLEALGYLEAIRNPLGMGSDGRQASGGKGGATVYRLKFPTRNGGSGNGDERRNSGSGSDTRNGEALEPERRSKIAGTGVPPISLRKNPEESSNAREGAANGRGVSRGAKEGSQEDFRDQSSPDVQAALELHAKAMGAKTFVFENSEPWKAHLEDRRARGVSPPSLPVTIHQVDGHSRRGWWLPTLWPQDHSRAAHEIPHARARGGRGVFSS
ncbi:MAG: hypothetical protein ACHQAY_05360 [Hyphomicrobiales bacterium]